MIKLKIKTTLTDRLRFLALGPRDLLLYIVCQTYDTFLWSFYLLPPRYLAWTSRIRAKRAYFRALKNVPAYKKLIDQLENSEEDIPETDKEHYIKKYSTEDRCVGGIIPSTKIMIDESSGSTGTPFNWVRSINERHQSHLFINYFARHCYGAKPWITINAFSMGAWATGLNMGIALQQNSIVKNTGPDIAKILHTLSFFGSKYTYLIVGYPPFLKQLIDVAKSQNFPWNDYQLNALVGGEGMSEGLRDYLYTGFEKVYSGYGATDLEIGIAGETPVSVAIRRLSRDNDKVRENLFGTDSRLPMIFQYNPLMHYIEINEKRELIFTITRSSLLSPRIRYNIHDEGGVARFDEIEKQLSEVGYNIRDLVSGDGYKVVRMPFVWVYGRLDFTISVMGANIYPEDLEQCVYSNSEIAQITRSFCQSLTESKNADVRPCFHFEIYKEPSEELQKFFSDTIVEHLIKTNADFREAWHEYPETLVPEINLHRLGEGPFKQDSSRIKQVRKLMQA